MLWVACGNLCRAAPASGAVGPADHGRALGSAPHRAPEDPRTTGIGLDQRTPERRSRGLTITPAGLIQLDNFQAAATTQRGGLHTSFGPQRLTAHQRLWRTSRGSSIAPPHS